MLISYMFIFYRVHFLYFEIYYYIPVLKNFFLKKYGPLPDTGGSLTNPVGPKLTNNPS